MAAKKKTAAKKTPAKQATPKASAQSVAVKVLAQLPALDSKLRSAYRSSFSEEQCEAWGQRTKAENVLREAEKWIVTMHGALKKQPVSGYSLRRLGWLTELLVSLEDAIVQSKPDGDLAAARGARTSAMHVATRIRKDLLARLALIVGGQEDLKELLSSRTGTAKSPQHVRDSLTGLIDLATRWRRDATLHLLAEDADLTDARLSAAYDALENLSRADEASYDAAPGEGDSAAVNRTEGRVLRELRHAANAFALARENGEAAPALVPGPGIRAVFANHGGSSPSPAAEAPAAKA